MMKKYTIFADYHIGHPYALKPNFVYSKNTVFLGDNFDLKNSLNSEVEKIAKFREDVIKRCIKKKGIYISGNHSLQSLKEEKKLIEMRNNVLFVHGDIIDWGIIRAKAYRSFFSPGKSKLFWSLLKYWKKIFSENYSKLKNGQIVRAIKLAKRYHCNTIIMAHFHPRKLIDIKVNEIRILVVPRGKTYIRV